MHSNILVIKILKYIDNNLYRKITMGELSKVFFYNKDYIMRIFKKETKVTIVEYINKNRIYNSLQELKNTDNSILKIAIEYGFIYQEYYCETFKRIIGSSPLKFRNFTNYRLNNNIDYQKTIENIAKLSYEINRWNEYKKKIKTTDQKILSIK